MLIQKIKELIFKDKFVDFKFNYSSNEWKILISTIENEKDDDLLYEILKYLMPNELITDEYGEIVGERNLECVGYNIEKSRICLYSGTVFSDCLSIKEMEFTNELDFYLYIFSNFNTINITTKEILSNHIKTPLQIFIEYIESENMKLNGFKYGGIDDDGYTYSAFDLQINESQNILVQFPQKDTFQNFKDGYLKTEEFEYTDIHSYNSEFLELLLSLYNDDFQGYISDNIWE
jgi:hypothetical protein